MEVHLVKWKHSYYVLTSIYARYFNGQDNIQYAQHIDNLNILYDIYKRFQLVSP